MPAREAGWLDPRVLTAQPTFQRRSRTRRCWAWDRRSWTSRWCLEPQLSIRLPCAPHGRALQPSSGARPRGSGACHLHAWTPQQPRFRPDARHRRGNPRAKEQRPSRFGSAASETCLGQHRAAAALDAAHRPHLPHSPAFSASPAISSSGFAAGTGSSGIGFLPCASDAGSWTENAGREFGNARSAVPSTNRKRDRTIGMSSEKSKSAGSETRSARISHVEVVVTRGRDHQQLRQRALAAPHQETKRSPAWTRSLQSSRFCLREVNRAPQSYRCSAA